MIFMLMMCPPFDSNASNFSVFDAHMECSLKVQKGSVWVDVFEMQKRIGHPLQPLTGPEMLVFFCLK